MEERDPVIDEVRETFHLKTFQERVFRLEAENKELKVTNSILQTQYNSHCETQSDILRTLHANLDENYSKIEEQESTIQRLQEQLERERQEAKDVLAEEKQQSDARVQKLQNDVEALQEALDKIDDFKKNKDRLEQKLADLERQLEEQEEAHKRDVSAFDRKKAIEIDQLKKDMAKTIKETRDTLKAKTKDQLDSTTKRTIMENEQMATELHFQSKETERLLDRNQQLMEENSQLRRNLQIHKDLENELARRTHVYQKLLKKVNQRSKDQPPAAVDNTRDLPLDDSLNDSKVLSASTDHQASRTSLGEETERLKRSLESQQHTLAMVRQEFAQYRRDHATLTQLQDQSTRLVIAALYELKNQRECDPFPPASYDENAHWQFTNMTVRQKEYFFRVLLEKLNSSMCGSCFPCGPCGTGPSPNASTASLPQIGKDDKAGFNPQFLWSVASQGAQAGARGNRKDISTKAVQTETDSSDPCFKEGLWNPQLRSPEASNVTASMVCGSVRNWGPPARSSRPRQQQVSKQFV
jgi:hypothetical protein